MDRISLEREQMIFRRKNDEYIVMRMTGNKNNYLSLTLSDTPCDMEVIPIDSDNCNPIISKESVREQVIEGVAEVEKITGQTFYIKAAKFFQSDSNIDSFYVFLTFEILDRIMSQEKYEGD